MNGPQDDVRLPFSTVDPVMGDLFSVLWESKTLGQTGNALKILGSEVLSSVGQQVLQMTLLGAMMSALQWPIRKSGDRGISNVLVYTHERFAHCLQNLTPQS